MREARENSPEEERNDAPEQAPEATLADQDRNGLIFDVSAMGQMNVGDLSLLLTASRLARANDQDVWITGLPGRSWQMLHALGLADEFKQFPDDSGDYSA